MRYVLIIGVVLLCVFGCKKIGNGYVKGTITETGTGELFPNVNVYLIRCKHQFTGNTGDYNCEIIDNTQSDNSGSYYLPLHKKNGYHYYLHLRPHNIDGDSSYLVNDVGESIEEKESTKDFQINAVAYMKIHLVKTSNSNNSVSMYYGIGAGIYDLPNHNFPFDTILQVRKVRADIVLPDFCWYTMVGSPATSSIKHLDTIFIHKGDTLTYPIIYN